MSTELEIQNFQKSFCPFGCGDIDCAIDIYKEVGKTGDDLAKDISEFQTSTGISIEDIDPVSCAIEAIYQEARNEIETLTGKDIAIDEPYSSIYAFGNFLDSRLDGTDEAWSALKALIATIPASERSKAIQWLYNESDK